MAKIPVPDGAQATSKPVATPYANLDFDTGQAAVSQGLSNLAGGLSDAEERYHKARQEADATRANDALTQYQHDNISALDGNAEGPATPDAPSAFLTTQGQDAAAKSAPTLGWLQQRRQDIAEGLGSDTQKKLFLQHSAQMFESSRGRIESHTSQQIRVARDASVEGRMASSLNDIANNYADDAGAAVQVKAVSQMLHAFSLSPEDGAAKVQAYEQKVAEVRLNQYLGNKDWKGAQSLYSRVKDTLGAHAAQFEQTIATERMKQDGDRTALEVLNSTRSPTSGFADIGKALTDFQELPEERRTEEAQRAFSKWVNVEQERQKTVTDGYFNSALRNYVSSHDLNDIKAADEVWLRNNAPKEWRNLELMSKADADRHRGLPPTPQQNSAMTKFLVDSADHPEKYATMTADRFNTYVIPTLAPQDQVHARNVLAQLHAQTTKPEKLPPLENALLLEQGRNAGIFPSKGNDISKWGDDEAQVYYRLQQDLTDQKAQYHRQNGKEPPLDEVKRWVNERLLQGTVPGTGIGGLFQTKTTRVQSELQGKGFEPTWSDADKDAARAALTGAGARVDDAAIEKYLRRKRGFPTLPTQAKQTPPKPTAEDLVSPGD